MENQIPQQPAQQNAAPQPPVAPQQPPRPQQPPMQRPPMPPRPQQPMQQPMMQQPMYQQPMYQQPMMQQPYGYGMPPQAPMMAPVAPAANQTVVDPAAESKFTGGLLGLIGINILRWLLIAFTLGIGTTWAACMVKRWYVSHTIINGCKLTFDGKGGQLLGNWIKWILLSIITLSIYSLWIPIKMEKWYTKHTHIVA